MLSPVSCHSLDFLVAIAYFQYRRSSVTMLPTQIDFCWPCAEHRRSPGRQEPPPIVFLRVPGAVDVGQCPLLFIGLHDEHASLLHADYASSP